MKVLKSWGTEGQVILNLFDDPGTFDSEKPVFISFDGLPVPFFIESAEEKGNRVLVKFEDVDTLEDAEELVGREVSTGEPADSDNEDRIIGMTVKDKSGKKIGPVVDFNDFGGNMCVTVDYDGREIMLPLHEDLIVSVRGKVLTLEIPDGLLD